MGNPLLNARIEVDDAKQNEQESASSYQKVLRKAIAKQSHKEKKNGGVVAAVSEGPAVFDQTRMITWSCYNVFFPGVGELFRRRPPSGLAVYIFNLWVWFSLLGLRSTTNIP